MIQPRPTTLAGTRALGIPATGFAAMLAAVSVSMSFAPAGAQPERAVHPARPDLSALSRDGEAAKRARSMIKRYLVTTASSVLALEARLGEIEETLPRLEGEERAAAQALDARRDAIVRLLATLQRLARRPAQGPVVPLRDPAGFLRARLLLGAAIPALENDARDTGIELVRLASLRDRVQQERRRHGATVRELGEEKRLLAGLVEIRSGRGTEPLAAGEPTGSGPDTPGSKIQSIEELIDRLARARRATRLRPGDLVPAGPQAESASSPAPVGEVPAAAPGPASRLPATGPVTARFGDPAENGWTVQGITIRTRQSGQVVAPRAGTVVFAEPFLGYGELLIIDHGEGYHMLLAGLERLDARVGDDLVSGEPVGRMGSDAGNVDRLYIELRRGGRPIDPLPWLTENSDKVGG